MRGARDDNEGVGRKGTDFTMEKEENLVGSFSERKLLVNVRPYIPDRSARGVGVGWKGVLFRWFSGGGGGRVIIDVGSQIVKREGETS